MSDDNTLPPSGGIDPTLDPENLVTEVFETPGSSEALGLPMESQESFNSRYGEGHLLGAGGMGEVWVCRDRRVGRDVAMKRVLSREGVQVASGQRFVREARVQGRLEHPSVVPVHDLGVAPDGQLYFVMKRIRGETLASVLEGLAARDAETRERYPRRRLLRMLVQLCNALDFAHSRGVVHRDVKPANVMLGDFGEVYLLDWGIARVEGHSESLGGAVIEEEEEDVTGVQQTREGSVLGTPGYGAPEQLEGRHSELDGRADLYAVGVMLFEVLTHTPLFAGDMPAMERIMRTLEGVDERPSERAPHRDIPPELDAICAKAMALQVDERFASARALGEALEQVLDGERHEALRAELAARHEEEAARAAREALSGRGPEALEARTRAAREVARALALKPNSPGAMGTLMKLMTEPPEELPEEVQARLERDDAERVQQSFRIASRIFAAWFLGLPILLAMGVKEMLHLGLALGMLSMVVTVCWLGARNPAPRYQYALVASVAVMVVILSRALGPFILVPAVTAVNSLTFAFTRDARKRVHFTLITYMGFVLPLIFEWVGWWAPSYRFGEGQLVILERDVVFHPELTLALMLTVCSMIILLCVFWPRTVRQLFNRVETRAALNTWQLEQLIALPQDRGET